MSGLRDGFAPGPVTQRPRGRVAMWAGAMVLALSLGAGVVPARAVHGRQQDALPDTNAIPPAMIAQGRALFHGRGSCFACHGASLEGGPIAPTLKPHP